MDPRLKLCAHSPDLSALQQISQRRCQYRVLQRFHTSGRRQLDECVPFLTTCHADKFSTTTTTTTTTTTILLL